jgi:hypothetical protein
VDSKTILKRRVTLPGQPSGWPYFKVLIGRNANIRNKLSKVNTFQRKVFHILTYTRHREIELRVSGDSGRVSARRVVRLALNLHLSAAQP